MNFKLAVAGHASSIEEIRDIIKTRFNNIDVFPIVFNSDDEAQEAEQSLKKIIGQCSGVLYTRFDPYKIMTGRLEHNLPVRYVDIDTSNLIHALLKALYHMKADILRISVDSLDYDSVLSAYKSLSIDLNKISIQLVHIDASDSHFVHKAEQEHRINYKNNLCSVCITNIRSVRDRLVEDNVPCVLLSPSTETYIYEIRRLILSHILKKSSSNKVMIVAISIQPRSDFYICTKSVLQETLERGKAIEYVSIFTQKLNGALITLSGNEYMIICNSMDMEAVSENYAKLDVIRAISINTSFLASLGIGYGSDLKTIKANAGIGMQRSIAEGGNRAYVVYSPSNIVGPIEPNEIISPNENIFEKRLVQIAEASALSINTIYKINDFVKQKKGAVLTSLELAEYLGVNIRTANRIIVKLEASGYAVEAGRQVIAERGRPTRLMKFLF